MTALPDNLPSVADARLPATYEAAKAALTDCQRLDECADWANKADALASYAKQADDETLFNMAMRIRARAVRRCGELLGQFRSQGSRSDRLPDGGDGKLTQGRAAREAGLSERQELTAVRVANVPGDDFERAVESDSPPTITALADQGKKSRPAPPGFTTATKLLGTVRRFAEFCEDHQPDAVATGVMDYEVADLRQQIGTIEGWLTRFVAGLPKD